MGGVSSEPSKDSQPWDALASPCVWVVWPGPEIWFPWLLLSVFPPKRAVVVEQGLLPQLAVVGWWRSRSHAGCLLSSGQRVEAPGGLCPFCGLWLHVGETSAPGQGAGDCVLLLAWPQLRCLWLG